METALGQKPCFILRNERGYRYIKGEYDATAHYNEEVRQSGWVELWRETSEQCMLVQEHYSPQGWEEAITSPHWPGGVMPRAMSQEAAYKEAPQAGLPAAEKAEFGCNVVSIE